MRRSIAAIPILGLIATLIVFAQMGQVAGETPLLQQQPVNITITCSGGQVDEVTVRPWTARASQRVQQQLRWRLLPNSGVTSATIRPKSSSTWPFQSNPPLTVNRNDTVDSGAISAGPGTYYYDIVVDCGGGETVVDPRMDIDP